MKKRNSQVLAARSLQVQRGGARAAVLGVNDGLVSILCIVLAVAGAGASSKNVLLAGFAGLIAGAVSMAAGEWISVKAQVQLFTGILRDIKDHIKTDKAMLVAEVEDSLFKDGHSAMTASKAAAEIAGDDKHLINTYARQVMGFNPKELGSPWVAAVSSFALFTLGALAPLAPWVLTSGGPAIGFSIVLTGLGGLVVGGYISKTSGENVLFGALRQLGIIALAAVVTYGVGYLFGVSVG
jgi:VIT1/CCC1 family predicted Fe2+/Mn2+ transporter